MTQNSLLKVKSVKSMKRYSLNQNQ